MSDFFSKDPNESRGANPWQSDPFAAYDDPSINPAGTGAPLQEQPAGGSDYSAWRRPDAEDGQSAAYDEPQYRGYGYPQDGSFGAQNDAAQDGYAAQPSFAAANDQFAAMGSDAPTRIARPIVSAPVNRAARAESAQSAQPVNGAPARSTATEQSAAPAEGRRRRAGRMARYENAEQPEAQPTAQAGYPQPAADENAMRQAEQPAAPTAFDPFAAGDEEQPEHPARRPAVAGQRYTGARTAMPQAGAPARRAAAPVADEAAPRAEASARPTPQQRPVRLDENGRPMAAQRPVRLDENGRPMAPQQRPVRLDENGRPMAPQQRPVRLDENGRPMAAQRPVRLDENGRPIAPQQRPVRLDENGRPIAPQQRPVRLDENGRPMAAQRPVRLDENGRPMAPQRPAADPYAAQDNARRQQENEEEFNLRNRKDKRAASVERDPYDFEEEDEDEEPRRRGGFLIPLLVVLLIVGGLLAGIMLPNWESMGGGLGTAVAKIQTSIKSLIGIETVAVKSFSVSPTDATAPVELVFNVEATSAVNSIRITDANGAVLIEKTLSDSDTLNGTVTSNSNGNIWTLRYTMESEYTGAFTVQPQKKDGTWGDGMTIERPVVIAAPVVVAEPVQGFSVDQTTGETPADVRFTVITSLDVSAVQILSDYGDNVASLYLYEATDEVVESADTRTWTLSATVADAYAGSYTAAYLTDNDLTFVPTAYLVSVNFAAAAPATPEPTVEPTPEPVETPDASAQSDTNADDTTPDEAVVAANASAGGDAPIAEPEETATAEPTAEPTAKPTTVTVVAAAADASADPSAITLKDTIYEETKTKDSYSRTLKINIDDPFSYAVWDQAGVLTFRSGPFRQNSAYGTVEVASQSMSELWKVAMEGSTKAKSSTLYGVSWPGQALIVKWPSEVRQLLGMSTEAKDTVGLREVIVASQNGSVYFLNLRTGEATRDPIDLGWPSNGSLSLATNASPMLTIGQTFGNLASKTVDNGLHVYNLLNNKELTLLSGKDKPRQSNYSGVSSAPIFDKLTGTMIFGGQNGMLYTVEMKDEFDYVIGDLKISPSRVLYTSLMNKQKATATNIDGSVAMYGSYAYYGDQQGVVQCVDVNTMSPVWAVDTGDNVDATIALDWDEDAQELALYTGNTILNQGKNGVCTIRRLDGLSGKEIWSFPVTEAVYDKKYEVGCEASPVVGQNNVSDMVYFTVTNGTLGATVYALDKESGSVKWSKTLESEAFSSPVAVYSEAGDAWLIQGESNGKLHMYDAKSGNEVNTMQLEGAIESTPAVYRDALVVSTTGKDASYIYGIKID